MKNWYLPVAQLEFVQVLLQSGYLVLWPSGAQHNHSSLCVLLAKKQRKYFAIILSRIAVTGLLQGFSVIQDNFLMRFLSIAPVYKCSCFNTGLQKFLEKPHHVDYCPRMRTVMYIQFLDLQNNTTEYYRITTTFK